MVWAGAGLPYSRGRGEHCHRAGVRWVLLEPPGLANLNNKLVIVWNHEGAQGASFELYCFLYFSSFALLFCHVQPWERRALALRWQEQVSSQRSWTWLLCNSQIGSETSQMFCNIPKALFLRASSSRQQSVPKLLPFPLAVRSHCFVWWQWAIL